MAFLEQSPWYQEISKREQMKGKTEGTLLAIQLGLQLKFGETGLTLLPEISQIQDLALLEKIANSLLTVSSLEELRQIYQV